jgi:hypothetical protein
MYFQLALAKPHTEVVVLARLRQSLEAVLRSEKLELGPAAGEELVERRGLERLLHDFLEVA